MARTLDQIISELNTTYQPQIGAIESRKASIPGQLLAEEQGLDAKKDMAFDSILSGARSRGTGVAFGGIPLAEQARYTASEYAPAVARLKQTGREQVMSLEDALNQIYEKRNTFAYQIKQNEDGLDESRRQFDQNMAFQREQEAARLREAARANAASNFMPTLGSLAAKDAPAAAPKGGYGFKNGKDGSAGFYFTNANGQAVSAATYAALTGTNIITLLQKMAGAGDKGAQAAYAGLKGPGVTQQYKQQNNAFFWGN